MKLHQEIRNGQIVPISMEIENEKEVEFLLDQLRPKGKWIDHSDTDGYVECPFCGSLTNCEGNKEDLHFCFNCGADMREGDKS